MHGMNYIGRFISNFKDFYNDINGATLTGAIDVVVVEQPDGTFNCSPFHVRFGKIGVLRSREKIVDIQVNGETLDIHMKLGESGEAFFVEEVQDSDSEEIPEHLATSPIPVDFEELYKSKGRRRNSLDLTESIAPVFENEVNDYTKRRHTANAGDDFRAKDFIKRQIGLGNIELGENSVEDLTLSLPSGTTTKISSDDISKDNSYSETIFQMDSLETEAKAPAEVATSSKIDEPLSEGKNGKKKRRKKSVMKKKNAQRKTSTTEPPSIETLEIGTELKLPDSSTDRSSLDSNVSEPELRDIQRPETTTLGNRKVMDPDFHFFSDTELTAGPSDSRPMSPTTVEGVLSDTEFEVKNRKDEDKDMQVQQSWAWGEFPSSKVPIADPASDKLAGQTPTQAQHNSMLSSVFSFMKHQRQASNSDGVYLADLSSGAMDPEVAARYFTTTNEKKSADADMDYESGNGPSLTQSPNSAEGCKSIDSDFEEQKQASVCIGDISLSLCGWDTEPTEERFSAESVPFSDLCNNPSILESKKLVVRIHNKYYNFKVAVPIITSLMIYQRPLPQSTIDQLCNMHMTSTEDKRPKQETKGGYSWWGWRRSRASREATPSTDTVVTIDLGKTEETKDVDAPVEEVATTKIEMQLLESPTVEDGYYGSQSSGSDHGKDVVMVEEKPTVSQATSEKSDKSDKCRKTLRLSSIQIKSLNLRDGMNEVEFSVTTAYQGTTRCKCHLYKWKWDDKIVISDIDGTITKSDVLGHILPIVGKDWAQSGVAQLFNKIKDNGYKLLYLSARAIGQARITREYLKSIKQGDLNMPDGPMLLNPTSLITAFHREVIEKKPEQFKISCMSDIRALFPADSNPFYAGYGNRINDVWAYRAVGIPIVRIFTINHKGELKHELTQTFQSSYTGQSLVVNDVFPPLFYKIVIDEEFKDDFKSFDAYSVDSETEL
uniref:phosphatidate phosphatase n=1 Tax=Photinus pyralis TaxID=7054 RepID=A0A1Y1KET5_PHOPY